MKQAYRGVDCTGDQERGTSGTQNDDTVHSIVDSLCSVGEVVKLHLPFPTLDNGTLVDQQLTFLVVSPDYGKVLEFSSPPAYSGMTPKGTANVLADSDGFLGIVAALCMKPFLLRPSR
ncbi:hypothetical protein AVEN_241470-1 [Araneus ventricosus]|uniref:Uncharacterized protein n=1 Tax=Araneus ventricosus TaxID=182803 RepID=A0A4Y2FLQ3_ARAVE|nr:hypothetical protein AVEN_241470-1 [Araneus ventricosus]